MAAEEEEDILAYEVARYMRPGMLPNWPNWLALRRHSRAKVRRWLSRLPDMSDTEVRKEFRPTVVGRFNVYTPEDPSIGNRLKRLTALPAIGAAALDAYLTAHPDALTGNAEAEICPKHSAWMQDIPRLRETLGMLLDSTVDVDHRIDQVLDGPFRLHGFGPATATTILECWNDGFDESDTNGVKYAKWTGHTERALSLLGMRYRALTKGRTYGNVWQHQKDILREYPRFDGLSDVDLFMYFLDPRGLGMG